MTVEQICVVDAEYRVWQPFGLRTMRAFGGAVIVGVIDDNEGETGEELFEGRIVALMGLGAVDAFWVAFPAIAVALLYCAVAFGDIVDVRFMYPGASGQIV